MERIQLDAPFFEGKNNVYLFDDEVVTLVDTGANTAATKTTLSAALADHNLSLADIEQVLLTHYHGDHSGLAATIQRASGASVHVHEADAPIVRGGADKWRSLHTERAAAFRTWGIPDGQIDEVLDVLSEGSSFYGEAVEVTAFRSGNQFSTGETRLEAVHLPGHTAGQSGFVLNGSEFIAGDSLLPQYTPNVGGADAGRIDRPLARHLESLSWIAEGAFETVWPGHRGRIDAPGARACEIVAHHERRAWRVLDTLTEIEPAEPFVLGRELFGDLSDIHIMHGAGESYAHLNYLTHEGVVTRTDEGYRLTSGTRDQLSALTEERWSLDINT